MPELKYDIPPDADPRRCRGCQALIWFVKTEKGRSMPVEKDGAPHWGRCPKSDRFRGYDPSQDPKRPAQRQAYDRLLQVRYRLTTKWAISFMQSMDTKFRNGQRLTNPEDAALHKLLEDHG